MHRIQCIEYNLQNTMHRKQCIEYNNYAIQQSSMHQCIAFKQLWQLGAILQFMTCTLFGVNIFFDFIILTMLANYSKSLALIICHFMTLIPEYCINCNDIVKVLYLMKCLKFNPIRHSDIKLLNTILQTKDMTYIYLSIKTKLFTKFENFKRTENNQGVS